MPFRLILILLSLMPFTGIKAGDEPVDWFYRAWQTEHGLPDNSITGIAQSRDGFLVIATKGGALRFNGTEFNHLPLGQISSLPSRSVKNMFLDRSDQIWLCMERGPVICVRKENFSVFTPDDGLPGKLVKSITDDSEGRIWLAYTGAIFQINNGKVKNFGKKHGLPSTRNPTLTTDVSGQVWLASDGKLGRLNDKGFELVRDFGDASLHIAPSNDSGIWITADTELMRLNSGEKITPITILPKKSDVTSIFEDRENALWIGTHGLGLYRFKDDTLQEVPTSFTWVECITQDRDGHIWVGTMGGGLNLIKPRVVDLYVKNDDLPFTSVRSLCSEPSGRLWVTSQAGHIAYRDAGEWHLYNSEVGDKLANCVATDSKGRVWIGMREPQVIQLTDGKQKIYGRPEGLIGRSVRSILTAKNGDVWIATTSPTKLFRLRDDKIKEIVYTGQIQFIRAIAETTDGTIWIGSSDGKLLRIENDKLINEEVEKTKPSIRTLHATADGSLWIGYAGKGIGHLKNGKYTIFTVEQGLFDNYISQIQDDGLGSLWITANRGLFKVSMEDFLSRSHSTTSKIICRVFTRDDGLPSFQPDRDYSPDSCRTPDGNLYFAANNGLLKVKPKSFRDGTLPPPVILEKVSIDGKIKAIYPNYSMHHKVQDSELIDLSQPRPRVILPPGHDRMVIKFAALSLGAPENVVVRYRLKPLDKSWEEPESINSVSFTHLPAGRYEFQLTARNNEGVWNKVGTTLELVVQPFYWETWWFKVGGGILTVLITGVLVFLILRRRHKNQLQLLATKRALEQERTRIARDIHDDLGASLTQISLLSESSSEEETNPVLDQIHNTARHLMRSMDEVVWAINPEHDTFDDLASYLSGYAQEFLSIAGIRCRLDLPMDLPEYSLSSQLRHNLFLAFKEALNNVVKYAKASEVRISITISNDCFTLKIADDGDGMDSNSTAYPERQSSGSGLTNMTSRMHEIGGTCHFSSSEEGTRVEFTIPILATR